MSCAGNKQFRLKGSRQNNGKGNGKMLGKCPLLMVRRVPSKTAYVAIKVNENLPHARRTRPAPQSFCQAFCL